MLAPIGEYRLRFSRLTLNINARLRVHGIGMQLTWDQNVRHAAQFEVRMVGDPEGNRGERMQLAAALFGAGLDVPFAPGGAPRSDHGARSLNWTWSVPTEGPVAKRFAELWPRCLVDMSATTFDREPFAALLGV